MFSETAEAALQDAFGYAALDRRRRHGVFAVRSLTARSRVGRRQILDPTPRVWRRGRVTAFLCLPPLLEARSPLPARGVRLAGKLHSLIGELE